MHPAPARILPNSTLARRRAKVRRVTTLRREETPVRRGLYRFDDPILGEAARVHKSAGDAGPYLSRYLYELLEFEPQYDSLPTRDEHKRRRHAVRPAAAGAAVRHLAG